MLRHKMNKLLRLLEENDFLSIRDEVLAPKNRRALDALIDTKCVEAIRAFGGDIVMLNVLSHSATYHLERQEIWFNRIVSYIFGLFSGILATALGGLLLEWIRLKLGI